MTLQHLLLRCAAPPRTDARRAVHLLRLTLADARAAEVAKKQLGGDEYFEANVGCFWHNVETRPYCRARLNQILSLLEESSAEKGREVAVREMRELLRLMSDDKFQLGTRLVTELLILGRPEAALVYMKEERLTGTLWELLDEALLEFMVNGPFEPPVSATMTAGAVGEGAAGAGGAGGSSSEAATAASRLPGTPQLCAESRVRSACRLNSHVVPLMIGLRRAKFMRQNEGAGGWDEANELVQLREEHWKKTPGALTWLSAAAYPICRQKCANPECMEIEPSLGAFSICSRCHETPYCSRDCQRAHWKAHKGPCRTMFLK